MKDTSTVLTTKHIPLLKEIREGKKLIDLLEQRDQVKNSLPIENKELQDEMTKLSEEINELTTESKVTQLDLLHAFARVYLNNRASSPGGWVSSQFVIGTHVAQFNASRLMEI